KPRRLDEVETLETANHAVPNLFGLRVDVRVTPSVGARLGRQVVSDRRREERLVRPTDPLRVVRRELDTGLADQSGGDHVSRGDRRTRRGRTGVVDVGATEQRVAGQVVEGLAGMVADLGRRPD